MPEVVKETIERYKVHQNLKLNLLQLEKINNIIKSTNAGKAIGPDKIPAKAIKLAANVIDSHLTIIINKDLIRIFFFF